ncbi:MAG: ATP-dependent zinc metalloprotease FtsH [Lachnospiraceae bacterium]|nr:ATP-dependent zinc metalloprotease FtsH [Lachnospiraceae bacterium]
MPLLFAFALMMFLSWLSGSMNRTESYSHQEFVQALQNGQIQSVTVNQARTVPTGTLYITMKDNTVKSMAVSDVNDIQDQLVAYPDVKLTVNPVDEVDLGASVVMPILLGVLLIMIAMVFIMGRMMGAGGGNNKMMNFGKSRAQLVKDASQVNLGKVAGLREEKEEVKEVVDFLKNPEQFTRMGAKIPKGILLVGPPGTGKTLLAKAIAGEAGVPFYSISGSDFVEMFVGVGAARVRDLFEEAKKNLPCIVFIDEIDAVARRRGSGMGGGHDEREQTLNQLLVEMDGFAVNEGIIVMAATNRVDILDPAILRPGRFDRKIMVGRPDVKGREEILKVHAKGKPLSDDVDLEKVARTTAGFTGADLANLLNEAAIVAVQAGKPFISQADIEKSFVRVGIGTEKRSRLVSEEERRITAYHEVGHAILFECLPDVGPVHTISIIPTGGSAAGYTMPLPGKDEMFNSRKKMLHHIMVSLGGRIAEELVFDDITTGASQDIKQATEVARSMVMEYGMSEKLGLIHYGSDDEFVLGNELGHSRNYGEHIATEIDMEVKRIVDECYAEAKAIILAHREVLDRGAELLLQKEKVGREEFTALFTTAREQ